MAQLHEQQQSDSYTNLYAHRDGGIIYTTTDKAEGDKIPKKQLDPKAINNKAKIIDTVHKFNEAMIELKNNNPNYSSLDLSKLTLNHSMLTSLKLAITSNTEIGYIQFPN